MKNIMPGLLAADCAVMAAIDPQCLYRSLEQVRDGRKARGKHYPLPLLLTLILLAKLAGETSISGVVDWTRHRAPWLRQHLNWPRGFPTNSTYTYALARTDAEQLVQVVAQVLIRARSMQADDAEAQPIVQVAMDGKALRGTWSQEKKRGRKSGQKKRSTRSARRRRPRNKRSTRRRRRWRKRSTSRSTSQRKGNRTRRYVIQASICSRCMIAKVGWCSPNGRSMPKQMRSVPQRLWRIRLW